MLKYAKTLFIIFITMLLFLTACTNASNVNPTKNTTQSIEQTTDNNSTPSEVEALIYVNGEMLQNKNTALITSDFIEIPFVCVFEALGANVIWESDSKATISYKDDSYILDLESLTLCKSESPNFNFLIGRYGGTFILHAGNKELIVDSDIFISLLEALGTETTLEYDKENNIVYITEQP